MAERPRIRTVVLIVVGIIALLAVVSWLPFLVRDRDDLLATPGPPPVRKTTLIGLPTGKPVCVDNVALTPGVRFLRTRVLLPEGTVGGPIDAELVDAHGGRLGGARFAAGFKLPATIQAPVTQSIRHSQIGRVCLYNHGPPMAASGTDEQRVRTRSNTTVDGGQVVGDLTLEVLGRDRALGSRLGELFSRAATFKPVTAWEIWVLAIVVLLGVPGGLALALARAAAAAAEPD